MTPLTEIFPSKALVRVLSLFLLHPEEHFYQRDIAERTGSALLQVQRALRRIERAGLVRKERDGNRVYYSADRAHPVFEDLRRVFVKTVALGDTLRQALQPIAHRIGLAFIFGSIARGEDVGTSDIDLLVVGRVTLRELIEVLGPVGREVGREFNPAAYSPQEFKRRIDAEDHFIREVVHAPKIWLVESDRELAELAKRETTAGPS